MNLTNRYIFLNSYSLLKNPQKWSTKYSYLTWGELSNPNRLSSFAVWLCTSAMMTSKLFVLDWLVQSFCQQSAALTSFGELPPPSQTAEVLVAACVVHACERFFLQKNFFYKFSQLIEQILFCFVCMYVCDANHGTREFFKPYDYFGNLDFWIFWMIITLSGKRWFLHRKNFHTSPRRVRVKRSRGYG